MKKRSLVYTLIWAIALGIFNTVVFVAPLTYDGDFFAAYIFVTVAFVAQLVCSLLTLREQSADKLFYRIPLITVSYTGVTLMLLAATPCMLFAGTRPWFVIVLSAVILGLNIIAVLKATAAATIVEKLDEKTAARTARFAELTATASSLLAMAESEAMRSEAKTVYEALRYSDPCSNEQLAPMEAQIQRELVAFAAALTDGDEELAKSSKDTLLQLIATRNEQCKNLK